MCTLEYMCFRSFSLFACQNDKTKEALCWHRAYFTDFPTIAKLLQCLYTGTESVPRLVHYFSPVTLHLYFETFGRLYVFLFNHLAYSYLLAPMIVRRHAQRYKSLQAFHKFDDSIFQPVLNEITQYSKIRHDIELRISLGTISPNKVKQILRSTCQNAYIVQLHENSRYLGYMLPMTCLNVFYLYVFFF